MFHTPYRIQKAVADDMENVDIDGSYLHRKCKRLEVVSEHQFHCLLQYMAGKILLKQMLQN